MWLFLLLFLGLGITSSQAPENARVTLTGDLEVKNVTLADAGSYTCKVENLVGFVQASATVKVEGE